MCSDGIPHVQQNLSLASVPYLVTNQHIIVIRLWTPLPLPLSLPLCPLGQMTGAAHCQHNFELKLQQVFVTSVHPMAHAPHVSTLLPHTLCTVAWSLCCLHRKLSSGSVHVTGLSPVSLNAGGPADSGWRWSHSEHEVVVGVTHEPPLPCSQTSSGPLPGPVHCRHGRKHCGMGTFVQEHYSTWCSREDLKG